MSSNQNDRDGDNRHTPEVSGTGLRVAPRPIARSPVDPQLQRVFGRPYAGAQSLPRHPLDAASLGGARAVDAVDGVDYPWRDPGAIAAFGAPALREPPRAAAGPDIGKLGVGRRSLSWD